MKINISDLNKMRKDELLATAKSLLLKVAVAKKNAEDYQAAHQLKVICKKQVEELEARLQACVSENVEIANKLMTVQQNATAKEQQVRAQAAGTVSLLNGLLNRVLDVTQDNSKAVLGMIDVIKHPAIEPEAAVKIGALQHGDLNEVFGPISEIEPASTRQPLEK